MPQSSDRSWWARADRTLHKYITILSAGLPVLLVCTLRNRTGRVGCCQASVQDMNAASNTKKRRLAALNAYCPPGADAGQAGPYQPAQAQPAAAAASAASSAAAAAAAAGVRQTISSNDEPGAFPYNPLTSTVAGSSTAAKLRIPHLASCTGCVNDVLEHLMTPNMPPPTARSMISSRTVDKSVVLDNPTAKLNFTKPSSASKAKHHKLAGKLLPRAERHQLCQLPMAGLSYAALLPLHELWSKYVTDVLCSKPDLERVLPELDWHGAVLRVVAHKNPIYTGRAGIVAKATTNTFVLISPDGRSSIVPLKGAAYEGVLPGVNQVVQVTSSGGLTKLQYKTVPAEIIMVNRTLGPTSDD